MSNMLKKRKKTKKKKTLDKSLFMFLLPEFIGVLVFVILPLIDVIIKSFQLVEVRTIRYLWIMMPSSLPWGIHLNLSW